MPPRTTGSLDPDGVAGRAVRRRARAGAWCAAGARSPRCGRPRPLRPQRLDRGAPRAPGPGASTRGPSPGTPLPAAPPATRSSGRRWCGRCRPLRRPPRRAGCRRPPSTSMRPRAAGRACAASAGCAPPPRSPLTWHSWYDSFMMGRQSHEGTGGEHGQCRDDQGSSGPARRRRRAVLVLRWRRLDVEGERGRQRRGTERRRGHDGSRQDDSVAHAPDPGVAVGAGGGADLPHRRRGHRPRTG